MLFLMVFFFFFLHLESMFLIENTEKLANLSEFFTKMFPERSCRVGKIQVGCLLANQTPRLSHYLFY